MRAIVWCVVICVVAAGCTPDQPDNDASTTSAPSLTTPPPVTRPLDPSPYETEDTVCDLLTDDQIVAFDLPRGTRTHKVTDVRFDCVREKQGSERWQADYMLWLNVDLVGDWYDVKDDFKNGFELRYIEDQPAAVQGTKGASLCNVAVRLAERKTLQVMVSNGRLEAACPHAIPVVEQIVRNLEG